MSTATGNKVQPDLTERQKIIFTTIAAEVTGFYGLLLTLVTAFLAATLGFIENIAKNPRAWTMWLLGPGWLALIASITLLVWIRWRNIVSGGKAYRGMWTEEKREQDLTTILTIAAAVLAVAGIALVTMFGFFNLHVA